MTVEDPIEYELPGVGQTQVNSKIDLTFATALRAILRQDPDIIMIGEIRDFETAQIAIQASLTGHLVLATLHTNDAASAVTRLIDMGWSPSCCRPHCWACWPSGWCANTAALPRQGCEACGHTGYAGRTGVFELLVTDDAIRAQIHARRPRPKSAPLPLAAGMTLMREDGERLIAAGITSREEVLRVTRIEPAAGEGPTAQVKPHLQTGPPVLPRGIGSGQSGTALAPARPQGIVAQ